MIASCLCPTWSVYYGSGRGQTVDVALATGNVGHGIENGVKQEHNKLSGTWVAMCVRRWM